ncbi:hypothetical protein HPB51_020724 [Rhipicephalus microplus]|uniref:Uncharacterized protein n=1 Tax=Rhipicephalus microplus TaxID=6941 RepID=A0A9J6E4F6_RHIMP|nr:hypothetical protein HPB51_020724 [Rhipicephalus microplus]
MHEMWIRVPQKSILPHRRQDMQEVQETKPLCECLSVKEAQQEERDPDKSLNDDSLECEENYFLRAVSQTYMQTSIVWKSEIKTEGKPVLCNFDTEANCSVISLKLLKAVTSTQLEASNSLLNTFFRHKKKAMGRVTLQATSKARHTEDTNFYGCHSRFPQQQPMYPERICEYHKARGQKVNP